MKISSKSLLASSALMLSLTNAANGAVVLQHWYEMGETGALPTDSQGSADFSTANGTAATVTAGTSGAPGSTSYLQYTAGSFSSGADLSALPDNNFAFGGWFMVDTILASRNDVSLFSGGPPLTAKTPKLMLSDGGGGDHDGWAGTYHSTAWVGPTRGTENSATADTWAHLAIVRDNGTSTFYINGAAQPGTTAALPDWFSGAQVGSIGGITGQAIGADDIRIYTFASGEGTAALNAFFVAVVPEPSAVLLGSLGLLILLRRRRA